MAVKKILLPFMEDRAARLAFGAAAAVAKEFKSHVCAVHLRQRPAAPVEIYYPLGGRYPAEMINSLEEAEDKRADDLRVTFKELCDEFAVGEEELAEHTDDRGATASWLDEEGDMPADFARRATASDMSVVAFAEKEPSAFETGLVEELLFQSGRPVLLCPRAGMPAMPKRVVVAWNGREEAARAVGAGIDFLKEAEAVKVLTVRRRQALAVNTDDITACLRLHGVDATQTDIELEARENETARLDEEIREFGAELVVMGAYSHSRWREAVLGGFTRHMLREAMVPVFMMQ